MEQNGCGHRKSAAARAYLGVRSSASGKFWQARLDAGGENKALHWAQKFSLPEVLARVLSARMGGGGGLAEAGEAARGLDATALDRFLAPRLKALMPEPYSLYHMDAAAERLARACLKGEKIAVLADYDVDGACCAALLLRFLAALPAECLLYIPDRIKEGYGPNAAAMQNLAAAGTKLIITADCGANAAAALAAGKQAGADVLVLDHHAPAPAKPADFADYIQVNPNQSKDSSGLGYLCAAGVVFMCLAATARLLRRKSPGLAARAPDLLSLLDLVALATVCDIVPLIGLNRAFVRKGLLVARGQSNLGLSALARAARLNEPLNPHHFGYILGPRINAGGRIGDAALGARLLAADSEAAAERIAAQLDSLNYGRQEMEAAQLAEALAQAEEDLAQAAENQPVFVCGGKSAASWHIGIVGLLAARLRERFARPAFVMTLTAGGEQATGSARSGENDGVNLGALIRRAAAEGLLLKGGGHARAAGFTLKAENIPLFKTWLIAEFNKAAESAEPGADAASKREILSVDGSLTARGANVELIETLERAGPFGAGNPQPVFAFPAHRLVYIKQMGKEGAHLRLTLEDGQGGRLKAVAFRAADTALGRFLLGAQGRQIHILGTLSIDYWNGQTGPQLRVIDAAEAE